MKSTSLPTTTALIYFSYMMVLASSITENLAVLKYLIVALIPVWIFVLGNTKVRLHPLHYPFFFILFCGIANPNSWHQNGLKDLIFIALPAGYLLLVSPRNRKISIDALFVLTIIFFIASIPSIYNSDMNFSFVDSSSPLESTYSFLFGIFCVAYLYRKQSIPFLISTLLAIVTFKRIVILGIALIFVLNLAQSARLLRLLTPSLMATANLMLLAVSILFTMGFFDDQFQITTGLSANAFTEGRQFLYGLVVLKVAQNPTEYIFFGEGAGGYYDIAITAFGRIILLHNDILKIAFEYGLISLLIFVYLMYRPFKGKEKYFPIFLNLCFLTDNTLIYFQIIFTFILVVETLGISGKKNESPTYY